MSHRDYILGDLHLGHHGAYQFLNKDGSKCRPWADNADDGDEYVIDRINSIVRPCDKLRIIGDVAIRRSALKKIERINGNKILYRGNHDIFKLKDYLPYFKDIRGASKLKEFIVSHIPLHRKSIPWWAVANCWLQGHSSK